MPALPIIAAVGVGVAAVGTAMSIKEQRKANKFAKQANKFERQKNELASARQKTTAIREARSAYGKAQQAAENQGVSGTSVAEGGSGSIISQMGGNLSFLDQYGFMSDQASKYLGKAQSSSNNASMWGQVAELGSKAYQMSGGF